MSFPRGMKVSLMWPLEGGHQRTAELKYDYTLPLCCKQVVDNLLTGIHPFPVGMNVFLFSV